jgi:hypothetical protein
MDMTERYAELVLEPHPAGNGEHTPRIKVSVARDGYNWFARDRDRADLVFEGSAGGRAFSAVLQAMFPEEVVVRRSEAGHPYIHGLRRKDGVNRKYFRLP